MPHEMALIVLVMIAGLYMAWNIGANDVANAMGTSVGSGALTLRKAVIIAAILEFCGAYFFGSRVTETIQSGIVNTNIFHTDPRFLAYGMLASLVAAGVWLQIASYNGWPVSTTHSIVGAVIGFGAAIGGLSAIQWNNVVYIVFSWILSPFLGGCLSYYLFTLLRKRIFYSKNPILAAKKITPVLVFVVFVVLLFILLFRGLDNINIHLSFEQVIVFTFVFASVASLLSHFLMKRIGFAPHPQGVVEPEDFQVVEKIFSYLQVLSACLMAFAHGANDVANAIGPLAGAIEVIRTGAIPAQQTIPAWALGLGGVGIVFGLATWGWRVIETIGKKLTELTPTRGFAAEFGTATTVLVASYLGLPISTTHTLVGAVLGVGLARGIEALDLKMTRDIIVSWVVTVPAGALIAVCCFYILKVVFG